MYTEILSFYSARNNALPIMKIFFSHVIRIFKKSLRNKHYRIRIKGEIPPPQCDFEVLYRFSKLLSLKTVMPVKKVIQYDSKGFFWRQFWWIVPNCMKFYRRLTPSLYLRISSKFLNFAMLLNLWSKQFNIILCSNFSFDIPDE